ncbi:MAG: hypothetical protein WAW92_01105, partial [Minisyncoccia bacterium]
SRGREKTSVSLTAGATQHNRTLCDRKECGPNHTGAIVPDKKLGHLNWCPFVLKESELYVTIQLCKQKKYG